MTTVPVKILFFAQARELSGLSSTTLELPEQILVSDLLDTICRSFNLNVIRNSVILSVDEQYCADLNVLVSFTARSEVAVIPPISGG